jgi:AraC-like DNA-binding protein
MKRTSNYSLEPYSTLNYADSCLNPPFPIDLHIWNLPVAPLHTHEDFYEVFLVTHGEIQYTINHQDFTLKKMDLSFVRPTDLHSFKSINGAKKAQHLNICIKSDFLPQLINVIDERLFSLIHQTSEPIILSLSDDDFKLLNYLKEKVIQLPATEKEQQRNAIILLLINMLSLLSLNYKIDQNFPLWFSALLQTISSTEFLEKSVQDIYEISPYSAPMLIQYFKNYLNVTPLEFLTRKKMDYACNLLRNTNYTVLDICERVGYNSLSHFTQAFKKIIGFTPKDYRKNSK